MGILGVDQIAARLDDRFRLLTGGSRTALPRQQTLQASIDWSYGLFSDFERALFNRLSVFAGGWTLEAAEQVCGFDELKPEQVLDLLVSLVNKSLIVSDIRDDETRYTLLETIRQYAQERINGEESEDLVKRHLVYFCRFADLAEPHLRAKDQQLWMDRVERDLDNIRASLRASLTKNVFLGLQLFSALRWLWYYRGLKNEAIKWFGNLIKVAISEEMRFPNWQLTTPPWSLQIVSSARVLWRTLRASRSKGWIGYWKPAPVISRWGPAGELGYALSGALLFLPDADECLRLLSKAEKIIKDKGDLFWLSEMYGLKGLILLDEKAKPDEATSYLENSLSIRRELNDIAGIGFQCMLMGDLHMARKNYSQAAAYYHESLECYQVNRSAFNQKWVLDKLCSLYLIQEKPEKAQEIIEQQIRLGHAWGDKSFMIRSYMNQARVAYSLNDFETMKRYCDLVLPLCLETRTTDDLYQAKAWLATAAWIQGKDSEASKLMDEVIDLWLSSECPVSDEFLIIGLLADAAVRLVERRQFYFGALALGLSMQSEVWPALNQLPVEKARYDKALATARAAPGGCRL